MDLISEVIRTVRVGTAGGRLIGQSGPSGIRFPAFSGTGFHIVLRGTCWLITEDQPPAALAPGDVVLTSSGAEHGMHRVPCSFADLPPAVLGPTPPPPGPYDFEFLCGGYSLDHGRAPQYLRTLPDLIVVSPDYDSHPEMRALIDLLGTEAGQTRMGSGATLAALLDLILIRVLRLWHDQQDTAGWPTADDPAIAAALRAIHTQPHRPWTIQRLSEQAGMPRTAFTRRFTTVVGQPPMRYLTGWRLSHGARLLRETKAPMSTIARQVGYSSEFAFSTAFRREYGVPPGRFRHTPSKISETTPEHADNR
ncbi:AraC family transcriptional regulator [Amycolatopsis pigmentata]|uniref:AraC family transcriptional regulator n=1 Tax=Amycolatopsis pigmentata TaxID=450801 RepID=A0ABW5G3E6_9PSEU